MPRYSKEVVMIKREMDIINSLPQEIVEHILTLMPIQDALRTSVLSRKWRYCWTTIPKLVFDDRLSIQLISSDCIELHKSNFVTAILHVLLLHKGPILEFSLCVDKPDIVSVLADGIISYLSRCDVNLKKFSLLITTGRCKLPSSLFRLQRLESLNLKNCDFEPSSTLFNGFSWLRKLYFRNVGITGELLLRFLSCCPLLDDVTLVGYKQEDFERGKMFTVVELLECLPCVQYLEISKHYMKCLTAGGMRHKLPTISLVHLKRLFLDVCILEQDQISCVLYVIRSSPNLTKVAFLMYNCKWLNVKHTPDDFLDPKSYSDLRLDHLHELRIVKFSNIDLEMEFVKLIILKSPMLNKVRIELNEKAYVNEREMCKEFVRLSSSRVSPSMIFSIQRPMPRTSSCED